MTGNLNNPVNRRYIMLQISIGDSVPQRSNKEEIEDAENKKK